MDIPQEAYAADHPEACPWFRRTHETEEQWRAFQVYLTSDPRPAILPTPGSKMWEWSRRYNWRERAEAYDARPEGVTPPLLGADDVTAMLSDLKALTALEVRKILKTAEKAQGSILKPAELTKFAEMLIKLDRLEKPAAAAEALDLGRLTLDELRTLETLQRKATADR